MFRVVYGYKCEKCRDSSVIYARLTELQSHAIEHSLPKFTCGYCDTQRFRAFEMEHHVSMDHRDMLAQSPAAATELAHELQQQQLLLQMAAGDQKLSLASPLTTATTCEDAPMK